MSIILYKQTIIYKPNLQNKIYMHLRLTRILANNDSYANDFNYVNIEIGIAE